MERYEKPLLTTKAYAQFENVFTRCAKGNAGICKSYSMPWRRWHKRGHFGHYGHEDYAAFSSQSGS